ncbi:uroporphyrinogen decarboxylase [Streptococcus sanguinis]|uniref:uroporphyrinogen decarboxylase n=1 Tax=Streptococcus sanguinis TaxID=1305 RepID=UPI0022851E91|nr:uroporphyrinogen decarboxylase [Streptococcus sanguinis]MCY7019588.1 uroporphyrinogen decarboxylase [Streptococcus sanguinis]
MVRYITNSKKEEVMVSKKELVLRAFRGEEVDRVPVGFWFHFVSQEEKMLGLNNPVIFNKSVEGHAAYVRAARPDFVKIMSDGFFKYPSALYSDHVESIRDLAAIQSIGEHHPWIEQQIEMVKAVKASYPEDLASFYNIFAPVTYLKRWFRREGSRGDREIADFLAEDSELTGHVLDVIAGDIAILTRRIIEEAGIEGIYLSTQQIQDGRVDAASYRRYIEPSTVKILEVANAAGGQTVLGGFENGRAALLNTGSRAELEAETKQLLAETGSQRVILGADCTVPDDFEVERLDWIRQAASQF